MKKFLISLLLGICAGIIDVIPMIIQKLDIWANLSAFIHWVVLGIIINYIELGKIKGFLKGLIIAEISTFSVMIIIAESEPFTLLPIAVITAILGSLIGFIGEKIAK